MKILDPYPFAESIASFRLLPPVVLNLAALTLPPLEVLAGMLALGRNPWRRAGALCLLALLVIFLAALASAAARGLNVDCGCFGSDRFDALSPTKNLRVALVRDLALAAAAWVLYAAAKTRRP